MNKSGTSLLGAIAILAAAGITSFGAAEVPTLSVFWEPSVGGEAVHHYEGVVESWPVAGGDTTSISWETPNDTPEISLTYAYGYATRAKVQALDDEGRTNGFSPWSVLWYDDGPPGIPSMPRIGLKMVIN